MSTMSLLNLDWSKLFIQLIQSSVTLPFESNFKGTGVQLSPLRVIFLANSARLTPFKEIQLFGMDMSTPSLDNKHLYPLESRLPTKQTSSPRITYWGFLICNWEATLLIQKW